MTRSATVFFPLLLASSVIAAPPPALVCQGDEPPWSLRLDGSSGTLTRATGAAVTLEGRLQEGAGAQPFFVFRGRAASGADLVATITTETCAPATAGAARAGGESRYTARVSLASGELLQGCCTVLAPTPAAAAEPASAGGMTAAPAATPALGGEITELALPTGALCRTVSETMTAFGGQRANFDCGTSGGDRQVLVGPLTVGPEGLLLVHQTWIPWREGAGVPRTEPTAARVSAVVLADGLACRQAGTGVALVFDGRRASYTCGIQDGDTVALLGEFEPVAGGFRIVRARLAQGDGAFALRSSETILVAGPR